MKQNRHHRNKLMHIQSTDLPQRSHVLYNRESVISSINAARKTISACKITNFDPSLTFCTNINSKGIKDLDVRPKNHKRKLREILLNTDFGNDFFVMTQTTKAKVGMWGCIKLRSSTKQSKHEKAIYRMGEKYRQTIHLLKG